MNVVVDLDEVTDLIDDVVHFYSQTQRNGMFTALEFGEILKEEIASKLGKTEVPCDEG